MNLHYFKLDGVYSVLLFVKCGQIFLELNSKRLYWSSGKEHESRYLVFMSSARREIRHFHIIVVQWSQQRNVQKSVLHVQIWCFVNLNLLLFWNTFPLPSPLSLLKFSRKSGLNTSARSMQFTRMSKSSISLNGPPALVSSKSHSVMADL